jgi:hypothetical protein
MLEVLAPPKIRIDRFWGALVVLIRPIPMAAFSELSAGEPTEVNDRPSWSLPPDYPMVWPNYAKARSQLAKEMGLGQQRKRKKKAA